METKEPTWEEIQPGIWKPENDGDSIHGVLISKKENVGTNESNAYYIENKDGQHMVWGSTILDDRLSLVNVGDTIKITYKGTQQNKKGQPVKIFKVERQKAS